MGHPTAAVDQSPILAAVDFSERFELCLAHGCKMAAEFKRPLIVAHVAHENAENAGMYRHHQKNFDTTPILDIARSMLEDRVSAFQLSNEGSCCRCEIMLAVVDGIPETRIPELAARYNAIMILMCSRDRTGLRRLLHGSITESVRRRANRPLVILGQGKGDLAPFHDLSSEAHRPATLPGV